VRKICYWFSLHFGAAAYDSALFQQIAADAAGRDVVRRVKHERNPFPEAAAVVVSNGLGISKAAAAS
jgi:hypothetical protein